MSETITRVDMIGHDYAKVDYEAFVAAWAKMVGVKIEAVQIWLDKDGKFIAASVKPNIVVPNK